MLKFDVLRTKKEKFDKVSFLLHTANGTWFGCFR